MRGPLKFKGKTLSLWVIPILHCLIDGLYQAQIARKLRTTEAHIYYYLRKLENAGLIRRIFRDVYVKYEVTQLGLNFLTRCDKTSKHRIIRLHNIAFKFPILKEPDVKIDWDKVKGMKNWIRYIGKEAGVTVELTSKHVIIYPEPLQGDDPYKLLLMAYERANFTVSLLEQKYGMQFGRGELCRKPHFGIFDPVLSKITRYFQLNDDCAKLDESKGCGEIDWLSPEAAKEYLLMPIRVRELQSILRAYQKEVEELRIHILQLTETQLELVKILQQLLQIKPKIEYESLPENVRYWS